MTVSHDNTKEDAQRVARYFENTADVVIVDEEHDELDRHDEEANHYRVTVALNSLIPNSDYAIYCYAKDVAEPEPNRMTTEAIQATVQGVRTLGKIPTVRITRRQTLHRGFRLYVVADAPGRAWCAAAPSDYGVPDVSEVIRVGAVAELKDPGKRQPPQKNKK